MVAKGLTSDQQQLVLDHLWVAESVARQVYFGLRKDDRLASAYYGMCRAAMKFDAGNFSLYAQQAAIRQIIRDWKVQTRKGRYLDFRFDKLFTPLTGDHVDHRRSQYDAIDVKDEAQVIMDRIGGLPEFERVVMAGVANGESNGQIARRLRRRPATISATIGSAREQLR